MKPHEDWVKSIKMLGIALNRFYWEGNPSKQVYSLAGIKNLAIGLPDEEDAINYLYKYLKEWHLRGYIKFNEKDQSHLVEVLDPSFPFLSESA